MKTLPFQQKMCAPLLVLLSLPHSVAPLFRGGLAGPISSCPEAELSLLPDLTLHPPLPQDSWPQHRLQAAAQEEQSKNELRERSGFSGGLLLPKAVSPVFMGRDSTASLGRYGPVESFASVLSVKHFSQ